MGKNKDEIQKDYRIDIPTDVDLLGYEKYSNAIVDVIKSSNVENTPLTIGIFGSWGSGKSSFLKLIEKGLNSDPNKKEYISFNFNAWKYEEENHILAALVQLLLDQVHTIPNFLKRFWIDFRIWFSKFLWKSGLYKLLIFGIKILFFIVFLILIGFAINASTIIPEDFFTKNIFFTFASLILLLIQLRPEIFEKILNIKFNFKISELIKQDDHIDHISFMDKFRDEIQNIINIISPKKPIVIYIDDLDRCLPTKTIQILEIIKKFLDIEGLVFIISADSTIIEKLVDVKYKELLLIADEGISLESKSYFEKLVQLPFLIPPISANDSEKLINSLYKQKLNINEYSEFFKHQAFNNPRRVKRIFYLHDFYLKILNDNDLEFVIFKLLIIQIYYPQIYELLNNDSKLLSKLEEIISIQNETNSEEDLHEILLKKSELNTEEYNYLNSIIINNKGLIETLRNKDKKFSFRNKDIKSIIHILNSSNIKFQKSPNNYLINLINSIQTKILDYPEFIQIENIILKKLLFLDEEKNKIKNLLDFIEQKNNICLYGAPGIGKTMILKYIERFYFEKIRNMENKLDSEIEIPIYISLINFPKDSVFEMEYFSHILYKNIINKNTHIISDDIKSDIENKFKTGFRSYNIVNFKINKYKILLLLDGFDEISEDNLIEFNYFIKQLKLKNYITKIIVTSRKKINFLDNEFEKIYIDQDNGNKNDTIS